MRLLTKDYFLQCRRLVLIGAVSGTAIAAMVIRWPIGLLATPFALFLLNFPYAPKTLVERLLRRMLIGFCLSLVLVYLGRMFLPFVWIGCVGSLMFGALIYCLRYHPPAAEPS